MSSPPQPDSSLSNDGSESSIVYTTGTPVTTAAVGAKRPRDAAEVEVVKGLFDGGVAPKSHTKTEEELIDLFTSAVESHPFVDRSHYNAILDTDSVVRDAKGNVVCVLLKNALPQKVSEMASGVLRGAPSRTSLRASIFGGESPLSGIAGYYDYSGSPVELKCRKTSFTYEHVKSWPAVFPMISYVSELYKEACPKEWERQNDAIPDVVRLRDSPFSTLTINQRFRTARHTDAGDFDDGMGVLAVLEGNFEGLHLGMPDFGVCFRMQPRDVLLFDTHHFHCNTELELPFKNSEWDRLTCVFYYRTQLGESNCMSNYRRRLEEAMDNGDHNIKITKIDEKDNGDNSNVPSPVFRATNTPFGAAASMCVFSKVRTPLVSLHELVVNNPRRYLDIFGEKSIDCGGLPVRTESELVSMVKVVRSEGRYSALGGFSEQAISSESIDMKKGLLSVTSLKQVLPSQLCVMYEESKDQWLKEVGASWKHQRQIRADREDFSWANNSPMSKSFFDLCDVAQQVMVFLLGNDNPSKPEEAAFWFCFASSMHDFTLQEPLSMPATAMTMKKLNVKLKDYSFGGTRYFKDQSSEEQSKRLLRKKRIVEARKGVQVDEQELTANWLVNDEYDYQEEDRVVDYKALGVLPPDENPSLVHARQARALVAAVKGEVKEEGGDDEDSTTTTTTTSFPSILHVHPNVDPQFYRKLLASVQSLCEVLASDASMTLQTERFLIKCQTTQLWAKVAMAKCGMPVTKSSVVTIMDIKALFVKLAEEEEEGDGAAIDDDEGEAIVSKSSECGGVRETVVSLDRAIQMAKESHHKRSYDVVILHHIVSTWCPPTTTTTKASSSSSSISVPAVVSAVRELIVPIAGLSRSATMVLESDLKDVSHSLLVPMLEVPFSRAVGPAISIVGGLKEAGGVVPKPTSIHAMMSPLNPSWVSADELKIALGGGLPIGEDGAKRVVGSSATIAAVVSSSQPSNVRYLGTIQFKQSPMQTVCHMVTTIEE